MPSSRCLGIRVLRMAESVPLAEIDPPRLADRNHHGSTCRLSRRLRCSSSACRADSRPRNLRGERGRAATDASSWPARHLGPASIPTRAQRRHCRGSRSAAVRTRWSRSALGHRHHRAPNSRGQGVLCRGSRCIQPTRRRLVDRQPTHGIAGHQRSGNGYRATSSAGWQDRDTQRSGDAVHLLGIHPTGGRLGVAAVDGFRRGLL